MRYLERRFFHISKYIFLGMLFACIFFGCHSKTIELYPVQMHYAPLRQGWTQQVDGKSVSLDDVQNFAEVQAGETLVLETALEQVYNNQVLMFSTKHREVRIFIDDVLCYEFLMEPAFSFLKTPGNEWHQLFLQQDMSGKRLRIECTSQFKYYSNLQCDFYLIHESQMLMVQLEWLWVRVLVGTFLLVIAILSYINGGIWHGTETRKYVLLLGDFYMVMCLWVFANAGSFDVLFRRPLVSYLIEMITVRMIPVIAYLFVRNTLSRPYKLVDWMGFATYLHFFVSLVLQFCFGVSFIQTLWAVHLLLVVGTIIDFFIIFRHLYETRHRTQERNYLFICTGILFASAFGEIWRYYVAAEVDILVSVYVAVGYFVYTCVAHVVLVHRSAGLDRGRVILQTNYNKLQNTSLMRQINAHFFFNVLNVISALCKKMQSKQIWRLPCLQNICDIICILSIRKRT